MLGDKLEAGAEVCSEGALKAIDVLIARVQADYPQLGAIVMGLAGTVHRGTVTEVFGYDELRGVNLAQHFEDTAKLPCMVEGDMHMVSMGYWAQCNHSPQAVVCIYLGEVGIGSGIVIEGKVWHGASEFAGELHYLPIENNITYAKTHFKNVNMAEYYGKVIRSYAALLNPDRVVLYENSFIAGKADEIRKICATSLPTHAIPQIELSNQFNEDYERGLFAAASHLLNQQVN
nr:ROK family protein [Paenibacillus sp. MMS18-CY102]